MPAGEAGQVVDRAAELAGHGLAGVRVVVVGASYKAGVAATAKEAYQFAASGFT